MLLEVKVSQYKKWLMIMNSVQPISYSKLLIVNKRMTVRELKMLIYKQFRHLVRTQDMPVLG